MTDPATVVFDVGKTNAKLTLWDSAGHCLERRARRNAIVLCRPRLSRTRRGGPRNVARRNAERIHAPGAHPNDHSGR